MPDFCVHLWTSTSTRDRSVACYNSWIRDVPPGCFRVHTATGQDKGESLRYYWEKTFLTMADDAKDYHWHVFVEDDVYLNVDRLRAYQKRTIGWTPGHAAIGYVNHNTDPRRRYLSGGAFILPWQLLLQVQSVVASKDTRLWGSGVNDMWLGEVLRQIPFVELWHLPRHFPCRPCFIDGWSRVIAAHGLTPASIIDCWHEDKSTGVSG